ncbi:MAG: MerR family transcriptional regulator [Chitinophagales bacterium]
MEKSLKIGEFAQLTGVTVKTVLHYHKLCLLPEAKRSPGGYRLYGAADLNRMRSIRRLKNLGLSLEQVKEVLGEPDDQISFRSILLTLQDELLAQIKAMQERMELIRKLLAEAPDETPSFKMVIDILGPEAQEKFLETCPEIYEQERKLYEVIDDLQWGLDSQDIFREVAEYFRDNPDQYQKSLDFGARITAIADLPPGSPLIEELARAYSDYLMKLPFFSKLLNQGFGMDKSLESMFGDMVAEVYSPSQMKMLELLGKYLEDAKQAAERGD